MGTAPVSFALRNAGERQGEHVGRGGLADGHRVQAHQLQHAARLRVDHGVHGEAVGGAVALGGNVQGRGRDALAVQGQHEAARHGVVRGNVHCVHDQVCSAPQQLNAILGGIEVVGVAEVWVQRHRIAARQLHRRAARKGRAGVAAVAAVAAIIAATVAVTVAVVAAAVVAAAVVASTAAAGAAQGGAVVAATAATCGAAVVAAAVVARIAATAAACGAAGIATAVIAAVAGIAAVAAGMHGAAGAGEEGEIAVGAGSAAVEGAGDAAQHAEAIAVGARGAAGVAAAVVAAGAAQGGAGIAAAAMTAASGGAQRITGIAAAAGGAGMNVRHRDSLLSVWKRHASTGFTASYARAKKQVRREVPLHAKTPAHSCEPGKHWNRNYFL